MTELLCLLDSIVADEDLNMFTFENQYNVDDENLRSICEGYFKKFLDIYKRLERHEYSKIAIYVKENLRSDTAHMLSRNISCILDCAKANDYNKDDKKSLNKKCYIQVCKLLDHINLQIQYSFSILGVETTIQKFREEKEQASATIEDAKKTALESKEESKSVKQQVISILGIFSGIVVAFSFSITTIGEALSNVTSMNVHKIAFLIFALGIVFVNALTLLMVFVAKLSGFSLKNKAMWFTYGIINVVLISLMIYLNKWI